jgi:eukaryotic-like serine/threonine-protein kinase
MPLASGARIGAFEIIELIGAGGMGEVYRARDARLQRDVALKVLPEHLTADPERLARFQREAQVLAALAHANIAHIYAIEETPAAAGGSRALVLELVEGPTLADRIAQGPLPTDEAIVIAKQIAEALDAAHEQGIVHRDLKRASSIAISSQPTSSCARTAPSRCSTLVWRSWGAIRRIPRVLARCRRH